MSRWCRQRDAGSAAGTPRDGWGLGSRGLRYGALVAMRFSPQCAPKATEAAAASMSGCAENSCCGFERHLTIRLPWPGCPRPGCPRSGYLSVVASASLPRSGFVVLSPPGARATAATRWRRLLRKAVLSSDCHSGVHSGDSQRAGCRASRVLEISVQRSLSRRGLVLRSWHRRDPSRGVSEKPSGLEATRRYHRARECDALFV